MPDPISWSSKILLAKIEDTYGTDPSPAGASDGILASNVSLRPMEGQDVDRELDLAFLGADGTIPADLHMKLTFRVELAGSGTAGTAPGWAPLIRACAVAETVDAGVSVTYNPISESHESVTIYLWIGGTLYALRGARGTCTLTCSASAIPYLEFDFTALYAEPTETARDAPTLTGFQKPRVASNATTPTFTIDGTGLVMRSFSMDFGNQVEPRFLIGAEHILIVDRSELIETTVEAVPLTTYNPYAKAAAAEDVDVTLVHGTKAGNIATLNAPTAQMQRPEGLANAQNVTEWPLRLQPRFAAGNDQWTLTLT